jgi:hypothetical protein
MVLTLYGKPIHAAVGTAAGSRVPLTIAGTLGYVLAGLPHQAQTPPLSLGFVSLIGVALMAPVSSWVAIFGVRAAHALPKRQLEIAFGYFCCWSRSASSSAWSPDGVLVAAQHQLVAAHFRAAQAVEEAHAEQAGLELARLRDQGRNANVRRCRRQRSGRA